MASPVLLSRVTTASPFSFTQQAAGGAGVGVIIGPCCGGPRTKRAGSECLLRHQECRFEELTVCDTGPRCGESLRHMRLQTWIQVLLQVV